MSKIKMVGEKTKIMLPLFFIVLGLTFLGYSETARADWACGSNITDSRDGKVYPTVQIGTQCWMAKNMDYNNGCMSKTYVNHNLTSDDTGWCGYYSGGPYTNEGLLYQWSAAMNGSTTEGAQGICPTGWHVPTDTEQTILENYVSPNPGTNLKVGGSSGFNALMTGMASPTDNSSSIPTYGPFFSSRVFTSVTPPITDYWSSSSYLIPESDVNPTLIRYVRLRNLETDELKLNGHDNGAEVSRVTSRAITDGYSVRCIKGVITTFLFQRPWLHLLQEP